MVSCGGGCVLSRPFSIHHIINRENVKLYFSVLEKGKGTSWLSQRQKGDTVELFGPLGNGFSIYPSSRKLLLVAGGMGVASLYFLAEETFKNGYSVIMMYGTAIENRYPIDYLTPGVKTFIATEDGSVGRKGKITEFIPEYIDWADQVFACGPMLMYRDIYAQREELLKDKPVQVSLEVGMGCGHGACYGCTIKTRRGLKQVCQDGPVFDLDDILWNELAL
jgi:dihydroorotate dehydrogenase electron transfer subunit